MNSTSSSPILPRFSAQEAILWFCFFVSGAAGLIYEVAWSRYLALFLGGTGAAHVIILSTYMGGLALGAAIFGRHADHVHRPLALYVALEIGIGLLGLLFPRLFEPLRELFLGAVGVMGLSPVSLHIASLLIAAMSLLPATILMGGTLPALAKHMIRGRHGIGRRVSQLYYLNSFGAVFGSLWAGFGLIRTVGLEMAMVTAGALNLAAALGAWISLKLAEGKRDEENISGSIHDTSPFLVASQAFDSAAASRANMSRIALIVIGFSGAASMIYEVAWIRLLALTLGSSNTAFALMLAAFISGIAIGSFFLSLKKSDDGYAAALGWCELGVGLSALASIMVYQYLPLLINHWRTLLAPEPHAFPIFQMGQFGLCFFVMLIPTIFMGATVPAASKIVASGERKVGGKIGNVFAINTVGTLFGAVTAGFLLMPTIGIKHTIEIAVIINLICGFYVLAKDATPATSGMARAWGFTIFVAFLYFGFAPKWDTKLYSAATYRSEVRIASLHELKTTLSRREFLYYKDGADASIAISQDHDPVKGEVRALLINGKPDASSGEDMMTQVMIGHLPLLIHRNPENVLVVGLGSGVTVGATTLHEEPKRIDCVELIPEVVEAARFFDKENHGVVDNPRVNHVIQDAKTFLHVTPEKYDVIINQPTNLWISGVPGLFSREYFDACRAKLRPGGMLLLWIQGYELLDASLFSILRTFQESFPHSTLFDFAGFDVAILGSTEPFEPDFDLIEKRMAHPNVAADLEQYGVTGPLALLSMQMTADTTKPTLLVDESLGGIVSDFFPALEYEAVRGFFIGSEAKGLKALDRRGMSPHRGALWISKYVPKVVPSESSFIALDRHLRRHPNIYDEARMAWNDLWEKRLPDSSARLIAKAEATRDENAARLKALDDPRLLTDPQAAAMKARLMMDEYRSRTNYARIPDVSELQRALEDNLVREALLPGEAELMTAELAFDAGRLDEAEAMILKTRTLQPPPREKLFDLMLLLVEIYESQGKLDEAKAMIAQIPAELATGEPYLRYLLLRARLNTQAPVTR